VADGQFEVRGVVGGEIAISRQRANRNEDARLSGVFDLDGQIDKARRNSRAFCSVMRPFRTASSATLATSYNHNAGTIAVSVKLASWVRSVFESSVASSLKHQDMVTAVSRRSGSTTPFVDQFPYCQVSESNALTQLADASACRQGAFSVEK